MAEIDNKVLMGIFGAIGGVFVVLWRNISGFKKDVQFKDVCEAKHKGLQETLDAKFVGIEKLMNARFDNLEVLVKKNGNSNPRIRT